MRNKRKMDSNYFKRSPFPIKHQEKISRLTLMKIIVLLIIITDNERIEPKNVLPIAEKSLNITLVASEVQKN